MTDINIEHINEIASSTVTNILEQVDDGLITDEQLLGELYGRLVTARALGWDIASMAEDARCAGDRLIEAVETFEDTEVED